MNRVLITGGAGFLGRAVCAEFERRGVGELIVPRSADCDLRDAAATQRLLDESRPDCVVHLAAVVGGIGANAAEPGRFFYENLMMGAQLIEQARLHSVSKFVCIGTICAYPACTPVPFKEDEIWNGYPEPTNAPYGIAKKALLVQLQAYRAQYGLNGIYLLPVNLYGPYDNFDLAKSHVIPALIRKCIEAREAGRDEVHCWGSGAATREFLYVDDCARAIAAATERYDEPAPVNIGSGTEISIRDLATRIAKLCRFEGRLVWDATKPDGQARRSLDTSRARELFGFEAKTELDVGLRKTIEWFEGHRA